MPCHPAHCHLSQQERNATLQRNGGPKGSFPFTGGRKHHQYDLNPQHDGQVHESGRSRHSGSIGMFPELVLCLSQVSFQLSSQECPLTGARQPPALLGSHLIPSAAPHFPPRGSNRNLRMEPHWSFRSCCAGGHSLAAPCPWRTRRSDWSGASPMHTAEGPTWAKSE